MTEEQQTSSAYNLGLYGTVEELYKTLAELETGFQNYKDQSKVPSTSLQERMRRDDRYEDIKRSLRHIWVGAEQAFIEQRPENMQVLSFEFPKMELPHIDMHLSPPELVSKYQKSFDAVSLLLQGRPGRQKILDDMLLSAVNGEGRGFQMIIDPTRCDPIMALLEAGADANAEDGRILTEAVSYEAEFEAVEALHRAGADFDVAAEYAQKNHNFSSVVDNIRGYQALMTGKEVPRTTMQDLLKVKQELLDYHEKEKRRNAQLRKSYSNNNP